jgi:hypothetical protein
MMKNAVKMTFVALLVALAAQAWGAESETPTFETRLVGAWKLWSSEPTPQPKSCRLLTIEFQTNAVARWVAQCDGKTSEQTGRYSIEISANLYHRDTLTHIIRIQATGSAPERVIHLVGVTIGSDNRVPAEALKFRDAFASSFVFVRDNGQPQGGGYSPPAARPAQPTP